jgi:hypothetical protein
VNAFQGSGTFGVARALAAAEKWRGRLEQTTRDVAIELRPLGGSRPAWVAWTYAVP